MKKHLRAAGDTAGHPISWTAACKPLGVRVEVGKERGKLFEIAQSDAGVTCTRCRRILDQLGDAQREAYHDTPGGY